MAKKLIKPPSKRPRETAHSENAIFLCQCHKVGPSIGVAAGVGCRYKDCWQRETAARAAASQAAHRACETMTCATQVTRQCSEIIQDSAYNASAVAHCTDPSGGAHPAGAGSPQAKRLLFSEAVARSVTGVRGPATHTNVTTAPGHGEEGGLIRGHPVPPGATRSRSKNV